VDYGSGPVVIKQLIAFGFPPGILYNVNFPNRPPDKVGETINPIRQPSKMLEAA